MGGKHSVMLCWCTIPNTHFMTIINTLAHLFAISSISAVKVVPLISMQATWLQILNFICKCGAADLNNI